MNVQLKLIDAMLVIVLAGILCASCDYRPPDRIGKESSPVTAPNHGVGSRAAKLLLESIPEALLSVEPMALSVASNKRVANRPLLASNQSTDPAIAPESVDPRCFISCPADNTEVIACPGMLQLTK